MYGTLTSGALEGKNATTFHTINAKMSTHQTQLGMRDLFCS
jgi:hypothetical protein